MTLIIILMTIYNLYYIIQYAMKIHYLVYCFHL